MIRTVTDTVHKIPSFRYREAEPQRSSKTYLHYREKRRQSVGKFGEQITGFGVRLPVFAFLCYFFPAVWLWKTSSLKNSIYNMKNGDSDTWSSGLLSELNEIMCANEKCMWNPYRMLLVRERTYQAEGTVHAEAWRQEKALSQGAEAECLQYGHKIQPEKVIVDWIMKGFVCHEKCFISKVKFGLWRF